MLSYYMCIANDKIIIRESEGDGKSLYYSSIFSIALQLILNFKIIKNFSDVCGLILVCHVF